MTTHNFTQEAQAGNWKVFVSPSTNYGYFENQVTETSGGLWFNGCMVTEYDGVFELPANVIKALQSLRKSFDKFILPTLAEPVKDFDPATMTRATDDDIARTWRKLWGELPSWMVRKGYNANPEILDKTQ